MKKKSKQPHLAAANQPFTPMSHKNQNVAGTPFHPLQLNDLATPKINKSNSNMEKVITEEKIESSSRDIESNINQPQQQQKQPQSQSQVDSQPQSEAKELKLALLNCIRVIEKMEKNRKTYKSTSTQCQVVKPAINSKPSQKKVSSGAENNSNNQYDLEKHKQKIRRQPSTDNTNRKDVSLSNSAGDSDLQDQINSMSLMLKKLQSRIDLIDKSSHV